MAILGSAARAVMTFKSTLGDDAFLALGMEGSETLGRLPEFSVDLVGGLNMLGKPKDIDLHDLLGTRATVTMAVEEDSPRHFNAFIARMQLGERRGRYESYSAQLRLWPWFMTRTINSRIFQAQSIKEILTKVLTDYSGDHDMRLIATYPKLDYCVQYRETDFDFVSRLMEEAGIYYFFEHTEDKHTMVLVDSMAKHKSKVDKSPIKWANSLKSVNTVMDWRSYEEVRSVKVTVGDYDYLAPATKIEATKSATNPPSKLGTMEVYEHPADVVQNSAKPEVQPADAAATQEAKILLEELTSMLAVSRGTTNAMDIASGMTFKLDNHAHDDQNVNYLVVTANYRMEFGDHEAIEDLKSTKKRRVEGFECDFSAISMSAGNFRPERSTPRPLMHGPHTAVVVGASGNEIETDKHGRVKVQFHWDRLGKKDENSSCWVRVAHPWAGKGFGMLALPRVGHEVVVSFLDGNPDRPLITGSVYNGENVPPYELPKLATVSGVKTRSSKEGTADTANELRFEDAKDKEYLWFQAQKDYFRLVKKNAFDMVGENETIKVKLTRNEVIGENWYLDVGKDVMHNLGKDLHVNVAADIFYTGGATIQLKIAQDMSVKAGGDAGVEIGGKTALKSTGDIAVQSVTGKLTLKADKGDLMAEGMTVKIKGGTTIAVEAGMSITLKAGASFVSIGPSGVDIVGAMVNINSGGSGGSADAAPEAKPKAPEEAKKLEDLTPAKASDYDKKFEDPIPKQ